MKEPAHQLLENLNQDERKNGHDGADKQRLKSQGAHVKEST
jgi:hypothetical protein